MIALRTHFRGYPRYGWGRGRASWSNLVGHFLTTTSDSPESHGLTRLVVDVQAKVSLGVAAPVGRRFRCKVFVIASTGTGCVST